MGIWSSWKTKRSFEGQVVITGFRLQAAGVRASCSRKPFLLNGVELLPQAYGRVIEAFIGNAILWKQKFSPIHTTVRVRWQRKSKSKQRNYLPILFYGQQ